MVGAKLWIETLRGSLGAIFLTFVFTGVCLGAHPLVTDDTGTQGKGKFQLEFNYEFAREASSAVQENLHQLETVVSYGLIDPVDLVFTLPYHYLTVKEFGRKTRFDGIADLGFEVKWRFYEREGLSLAVKPGLTLPTGDEENGLGAGKVGGGAQFIATQVFDPLTFHFNAGYTRNENKFAEETNIWNVSLATEVAVCPWLKAVANVGAERNTEKGNDTPAAFLLGGFILPVTDYMDLSVGVKGGLTEPESDYALLAGVAFRF